MDNWLAVLYDLNMISVTVRLLLSILFAGIIGLDRQERHHPAGLRTHILVCLGSTMTTMLGQYLFLEFGTDPSRIGAQVVSGIGFLGVGTIILNGGHVRGITTAAGLWASACMGLALGIGFYEGAILGFLAVLFALIVVRWINIHYYKKHPRQKYITISLKQMNDLVYVTKLLHTWGASVNNVHISNNGDGAEGFSNSVTAVLELNMKTYADGNTILVDLLKEDCVLHADYTAKNPATDEETEDI